ncbi:MAG: pyridoxamine 5'-phosphate oxidase family protein [Vicinamibacterales bacterium]
MGHAACNNASGILEHLYTTLQRTWFPKRLDDPDITLVRFDAEGGNYWDSPDTYVGLGVAFAKAIVTGKPGKSGNAGIARL